VGPLGFEPRTNGL